MQPEIDQIIVDVCTADSLKESLRLFTAYSSSLRNYKFIFAARGGAIPGFSVNRDFSDGSAVRSLFGSNSIFVLDRETFTEMRQGRAIFPIDYSVSLDTQAISYLEPYIEGKQSRLPKDFEEIFQFIARKDVNVDPSPYLLENLFNIEDPNQADRVFEKIKAYEVLRTIDVDVLRKRGIVQSTLSSSNLTKKAQEHIGRMYRNIAEERAVDRVTDRFSFFYWHLLAMIAIQLSTKTKSTEEKLRDFIGQCDSNLATLSFREISIAKAYFDRGQNLTFFGKVQKGKKNLFNVVRGMAWDILHIRQMEENLTLRPAREARYFFPSFLTCDKRLVEIIELYPLKACAYDETGYARFPFFDGDWLKSISPSREFFESVNLRYFSDDAVRSRAARRGVENQPIKQAVTELERIVADVSGVDP